MLFKKILVRNTFPKRGYCSNQVGNIVPWFQRLLLRLHRITITVIKSYQGIQVTAMKRQKYRKGNKLSENTYKHCVT